MEVYLDVIIDGREYKIALKTRMRRVLWARVFKRTGRLDMQEIRIKKVKSTTSKEELECWIRNLKRNLRKQRGK